MNKCEAFVNTIKKISDNSEQTEIKMEKVLKRFDSIDAKFNLINSKFNLLEDKIITTRYFITIGFSIIGLLIVTVSIVLPIIFKFIG